MCDAEHWVNQRLDILRYYLSHLLDHGWQTNGLVYARYGHSGTDMGRKATPCTLHPIDYHTLDGGSCTRRWLDDAKIWHTPFPSNAILYTLDIGHLDDDFMLGFDGDDGVWYHLVTTWWLDIWKGIIPSCLHLRHWHMALERPSYPIGGMMSPHVWPSLYYFHDLSFVEANLRGRPTCKMNC